MRPSATVSVLLLGLATLGGCHLSGRRDPDRLESLVAWMSGTFSSQAQHLVQPEDYFDIHLVMAPIWTERKDGPWLYVEQAAADTPESPYRQRVYRLVSLSDGRVRSDVYTLPGDPLAFAGAWKEAGLLGLLSPDDLQLRTGCSVFLTRRPDGTWSGATEGQGCPSERAGASYATSEVTITADSLTSWDRGFDAAGRQVWGAVQGPYVFARVPEGPAR